MSNQYSVKDKLVLFLLATGVFCFGVVFPDSFSDHVKLVHFSAHFGMSFLLALCFYMFCAVKLRISKALSYTILISLTLMIGVVYKYWEVYTQGMLARFSFSTTIELTGTLTSMSQNLSGLMAAMLLIEGMVHRNLIMSLLRTGNLQIRPIEPQVNRMGYRLIGTAGNTLNPLDNSLLFTKMRKENGSSMPAGSQFSPDSSENN